MCFRYVVPTYFSILSPGWVGEEAIMSSFPFSFSTHTVIVFTQMALFHVHAYYVIVRHPILHLPELVLHWNVLQKLSVNV